MANITEEIGGIEYFIENKNLLVPYVTLYLFGLIVGCIGLIINKKFVLRLQFIILKHI